MSQRSPHLVAITAILLLSGCKTFQKPEEPEWPSGPIYGEEIEDDLLEGDIVLRAGLGSDAELIRELTASNWSHAGLIVKDGTQKYVIDNYPGRSGGSIAKITVSEFFSHASAGAVLRYDPNRTVPEGASAWAEAQIGTGYAFDLLDPYTNNDKTQYCSEFVWRAYIAGGDNLVPTPINLKGANTAATRDKLIDYAKGEVSFYQKPFVEAQIDDMINRHPGTFIAPFQLDTAPQTSRFR